MHTICSTIIKSNVLSPITLSAYGPHQNISRGLLKPRRCKCIWAPVQPSNSRLLRPYPGLSLEHPDSLPPGERYSLKIRGPYRQTRLLPTYGRVPLSSHVDFVFSIPTEWNYRPSENCQLVWDADTRSLSLFTESEHPVPGTRRYLEDLVVSPSKVSSSKLLVELLVGRGYISQEEADKLPKYCQTDYNLARLQEMGFSQRTQITTTGRSKGARLTLRPRFQTPDHTLRLRSMRGCTPAITLTIAESEKYLIGHEIRFIPHVITDAESGPRLGIHLVEVVGHPEPDFTTVNRPLMLQYKRLRVKAGEAESRPLNDHFFLYGKAFLEFVELVNKHRQSSLS